uniref:Uncharacterized protein n=1 Tax=Anguilla anguilla TaxID=7936 RepID=A0A0E9V8R1_ANGAN
MRNVCSFSVHNEAARNDDSNFYDCVM